MGGGGGEGARDDGGRGEGEMTKDDEEGRGTVKPV